MRKALVGLAWVSVLVADAAAAQHTLEPELPAAPAPKAQWGTFGVDLEAMDRNVRPGDDFWAHVNGTWERTAVIPPDRGTLSQVARLNDLSYSQVRTILEEMTLRRATLAGDEARAADFYASVMDQRAIDSLGLAPLEEDLRPIHAATSHSALAAEMGRSAREWQLPAPVGRLPRYSPSLFPVGIGQDSKDPTRYMSDVRQGGLGMSNRDYYLKTDDAAKMVQADYRAHLAKLLELTGTAPQEAAARASDVYDFERRVAEAHWPLADSRDADKVYNPWSLADLETKAPGFDWRAYMTALGLEHRSTFVVGESGAIIAMARLFGATPLPVLKDWLAIRLAKDRALVLPSAFAREEFAFSGGVLLGAPEAPARWLQAVELTANALTDAVSKPYLERHFPPESKRAMEELVSNILAAMDRRLANLSWMTPETKVKARAKLAAFTPMIGYPARWRSYEGMAVSRNHAYANYKAAARHRWDKALARIDGPVDRKEWKMMPITANAYSDRQNNQIIFGAAYLQPPHFDLYADPAVNYGSIGYTIGHEISHHFDDQGSKFDPDGRLDKWWTDEDLARFDERKIRLVAQYDAYEVLPGLNVRGAQTLGENIADNAGIAIAWDAYQLSLEGKPAPIIDGFSGAQRFFLSVAQDAKNAYREAALRQAVLSKFHTPARWRTWGAVRNHDAWYEAFNVRPGDRLYLAPEDRVKIWE